MLKSTLIRVALLVATLTVTATFSASTASATLAIEITHEGGTNCNPCVSTAAGESHLNLFGVRVSTCADSFTDEIYHDGTGHVAYTNSAHDSGGTCTRTACNGVGEAPGESEFDIFGWEEILANVLRKFVRICLDTTNNPNATGTHCTAPVDVSELATNHRYRYDIHATCAGGLIEVEGSYAETGGEVIEIIHR